MSDVKQFLLRRLADAWAGAIHWPTGQGWRRCLAFYLAFAVCAALPGFASGLLRFEPVRGRPVELLALATTLLVRPAIVEEFAFRGLLLPRKTLGISRRRLLLICSLALAIFVASHVINGLLFHVTARSVFTHPSFLLLAAMLGALCSATYLTTGSLWPGILAHWVTVTIWISLLGGYRLVAR